MPTSRSGHRLSRIVTRTGDQGETGLANGARLGKSAPRIQAIGDIDELNSALGLILAEELPQEARSALQTVQHDLFDLGGELSLPETTRIQEAHIDFLERAAESLNADLPRLKEFILPGGCRAAAQTHLARAICRRAERTLVALSRLPEETTHGESRRYLNRLSDFLFLLARALNRHAQQEDILWRPRS
ncbi:MAG: cob(I)yrinic acid a,c-diamide adenosyltransferase [Zoogloeaceae bacterium]|jgi:cob(I)alamin adenosyltransferase|nr:cob(I)yrinic acid a,c-diamide adenosyltransferase [Zoogloeaceae bacterium]